MESYFEYGEKEISYLKKKDKRLGEVIDRIGPIRRRVIPDLFTALVHSIVGQQISTKAHETIWRRIEEGLDSITAEKIHTLREEELQRFGLSFRKVTYMKRAAAKVLNGELDINQLYTLEDNEVVERLTALDGIGVWSAEMLMLFSMQRPDILSYGDLAIRRGICLLYHHRKLDRERFERYRRRYSPYGSVASLYLWAVAGGQLDA